MPIRNLVHRRNHKERSQPTQRAKKFGLLEKHKDYLQRARDHHSKRDRIKRLREKALERNKDEFYFAMLKDQTDKGVHIQSRGNEALPVSIVSLLKTQDVAYVRRQITMERKRIECLVAQLAPNMPQMRVEWIQEKESRMLALREAGLLCQEAVGGEKKKGFLELSQDKGEGKVGSQGKRTVWLEGADEVRAYSAPCPSPTTLNEQRESGEIRSSSHRAAEDYDLDGIDEDLLIDEGELTDSDSVSEEDDSGDIPTPSQYFKSPSSSSVERRIRQLHRQEADRRRSAEKHCSYLLSLLRARQIRLEALLSTSSRLELVRALMANRGGTSVSKSPQTNSNRKDATWREAVAAGKMTKNGLALSGNEREDQDQEQDINGRKKSRNKVVFKFGKERNR